MHRELPETGSDRIGRRECLARCAGLTGMATLGFLPAAEAAATLHPAKFYQRMEGGKTRCLLCPNVCVRGPGEDGHCLARGNRNGAYYSLVYGRACVIALDAVEKCPLYHFRVPGKALSVATAGCNLRCAYCQNWSFSQYGPDSVPKTFDLSPEQVVAKAVSNKAGAVAFFYTEPTVYFEYMIDIARSARQRGLKTVMVTAGYINPEPLKELLPHIDAVTLGLKGWNEDYYRRYLGGELRFVKRTVELLAAAPGVWWEAVTLLVPSLNDSMDDIAAMSKWLCEVAGPSRPLHFTRFRPEYRLARLPMTPAATLTRARETARAQGLKHVYVGNLPGHEGSHTYCPQCKQMVIERLAFTVLRENINGGLCRNCGYRMEGVWS